MVDNHYISNTPHRYSTMEAIILIACTLVALPLGRAVARILGVA
jgi:hypothetical protein